MRRTGVGFEAYALTTRAHGCEQARRGRSRQHQGGPGRWLFEDPEQRVLGFVVHPLGVGDDRCAPTALVGSQVKRALQRANLADPHPGIAFTALDPEEVRVIADVAQQRPVAAGSVERDRLPRARPSAVDAFFAGAAGLLADEGASEVEGRVPRRRSGAGQQIRRVDATTLKAAAQKAR